MAACNFAGRFLAQPGFTECGILSDFASFLSVGAIA
jgi:hypothetical protein